MNEIKNYFLCGIGGSGMLPLALILRAQGHRVEGSDRALDQGRLGEKFDYLESLGISLHKQDGSGVRSADQIVVRSGAVEDTVPDVVRAKAVGAGDLKRPALLAELFNAAPLPIGVAGTSGKSTTTAMIGWILDRAGKDPTIMNGAVMKNYATAEALFASARVGAGDAFVSELDESDGSIALYRPKIAVLNNIALDHKSMDELRALFTAFLGKAEISVLNLDNAETAALVSRAPKPITYGVEHASARLTADDVRGEAWGVSFSAMDRVSGERASVTLKTPGRHNVSNALAAIGAAIAARVSLAESASALSSFEGVKRRLEIAGERDGVVVIDDFAHNPDKIAATLRTLKEYPGRLLVLFQPHGFGPLKLMRAEFVETFATHLREDDLLVMPEPLYFGGTTTREVFSRDIVADVAARGRRAEAFETRDEAGVRLLKDARAGDRILIMGARDDTLSQFATGLLRALA
jgi:UDP-N-acetylmuramate--alanine ligase